MRIEGWYFEPMSSKSHLAKLNVRDSYIRVEFDDRRAIKHLDVESIQGNHDIYFIGGAYFRSNDKLPVELIDRYRSSTQRRISWLEKFSLSKAIVLLSLLILAGLSFRLLFQSIESVAVAVFPVSWEERVGAEAYEAMSSLIFSDSDLSLEYQTRLREKAQGMAEAAGLSRRVEIFFRGSELLGPNALAFPGGPVVLTDELVELLADEQEVLAVIAHELAHVEQRHSLRQAIGVAGVSILVFILFGADESAIEELAAVVVGATVFENSRDFEKEADLVAVDYLIASDIDPSKMMNVIRKLTDYYCPDSAGDQLLPCESETLSWFSTHPSGAERIEYLDNAIRSR